MFDHHLHAAGVLGCGLYDGKLFLSRTAPLAQQRECLLSGEGIDKCQPDVGYEARRLVAAQVLAN